jgi:hypothetical protein
MDPDSTRPGSRAGLGKAWIRSRIKQNSWLRIRILRNSKIPGSGSEYCANESETETSIKAFTNVRTGIKLFNRFSKSPYDSEHSQESQSKLNFLCRYR